MTDQKAELPEGELFAGQYQIERLIGEGGFGAVYKARQIGIERTVALKLLHRDQGDDRARADRFIREAQLIRDLEHPHIVRLHDYGTAADGRLFIALQFLDGAALDDRLERSGRLSLQRTAHITAQVLRALMEAHKHGIIHRDIKPSNIFLCQYSGSPDFVKLLDFGLAKPVWARPDGPEKITVQGQLVGTPIYMAPEQILGEGLGPATDLYALGLVMAEMLTGQTVYGGDSLMHIYAQQLSREPAPVAPAVLASPLGEIVLRATSKDASARFESAAAMLEALQQVVVERLGGGFQGGLLQEELLDVPAPPLRSTARAAYDATLDHGPLEELTPQKGEGGSASAKAAEAGQTAVVTQGAAARRPRRSGAIYGGIAAAVLLLLGGGAAALLLGSPADPEPEEPSGVQEPAQEASAPAPPTSAGVATRRARRRAAPPQEVQPLEGSPASFEPMGFLAEATKKARRHERDAQLVQVQMDHLDPTGVVDLTAEEARVLYRFRSPGRSRGSERRCLVEVEVLRDGVRVSREASRTCAEPLAEPPACTPAQIWGVARRMDPKADKPTADLTLLPGRWFFRAGMDESVLDLPDRCD